MTTSPETGQPRTRWWSRPDIRGVLLLWVLLTALLVVFALLVPDRLMGPQASNTMSAVEGTFTVFSVAAAPVAALVWALAIYSLLRWRHTGSGKPGDETGSGADDGPPIRGNRWATGGWIGGSVVLCLFLLVWGLTELQATAAPTSPHPMVVNVTGQQWVWSFSYPGHPGVETDELYLPVNQPVLFQVSSDDVIHSFWIVQMGIKVDANPGVTTTTQTTPTRVGTYDVRCAELCGLLHADMETPVHVMTGPQFASWMRAQEGSRS